MIAATATFTAAARRLGYGLGGDAPVRCRRGHVFTTLWIPGVNFKALDLGPARVQWCPVGRHWSLVAPLRTANLTPDERRSAAAHHDLRIP
jgi:hypothetical protein